MKQIRMKKQMVLDMQIWKSLERHWKSLFAAIACSPLYILCLLFWSLYQFLTLCTSLSRNTKMKFQKLDFTMAVQCCSGMGFCMRKEIKKSKKGWKNNSEFICRMPKICFHNGKATIIQSVVLPLLKKLYSTTAKQWPSS